MEGEEKGDRYPNMEGKWIARQPLSSGSTRWSIVEDVFGGSETANGHGRKGEGLKLDDEVEKEEE